VPQKEGGSSLIVIARRCDHAPRHFNRDRKREIDPLILALSVECVPPLPVFLRPRWIAKRCIHGRDGHDPPCHGDRIVAKQILFDARFEQGFPRPPGRDAVFLLPPVEFGKGIIHGLGATLEIADLGRLGEALQYVFDKGLLIRPALAFGDDVEGYTDRVSQLHYRLIKVDNFAGPQRTCEFENCRPFQPSVGGLFDLLLAEERNDLLGNAHR
jgi:hypothetical protein